MVNLPQKILCPYVWVCLLVGVGFDPVVICIFCVTCSNLGVDLDPSFSLSKLPLDIEMGFMMSWIRRLTKF